MTQQSLSQLPSVSLVDLISPSSFHPGVLHGDEIWHLPLGNSEEAAIRQVIGRREGRRNVWPRKASASANEPGPCSLSL